MKCHENCVCDRHREVELCYDELLSITEKYDGRIALTALIAVIVLGCTDSKENLMKDIEGAWQHYKIGSQ